MIRTDPRHYIAENRKQRRVAQDKRIEEREKIAPNLMEKAFYAMKTADMFAESGVDRIMPLDAKDKLFKRSMPVSPLENVGGQPGFLSNANKNMWSRFDVQPGVKPSDIKTALGDEGFKSFTQNKYGINPDDFTSAIGEGSIDTAMAKGTIKEAGGSLLGTAGKVATVAGQVGSAVSAADEFSQGNYMEAANDTARVFYPWLASQGPLGWGAMGVNELLDMFT